MNHNNIILIGMPGSGKSTIGVVLAKVLGYQFIDTDLIIQKEEGKLLWQIIEEKGVEEFIRIEDRINSNVHVSKSVIAPGGSAIFGDNAMKHFQEIGTIVYLDVDYPILKRRVGNFERRGVILRHGNSFHDIYTERLPYYHKYAHVKISENNLNISQTVSAIVDALNIIPDAV